MSEQQAQQLTPAEDRARMRLEHAVWSAADELTREKIESIVAAEVEAIEEWGRKWAKR